MRARLDMDSVLEKDVGRLQHLLAVIDRIGDMVEAPPLPRVVARIGDVVALVVHGEPAAAILATVQQDLLRDAAAERLRHEVADRADILRQQVEMVDPPHAAAASVVALRLVLERWPLGGRRFVLPRLEIDLEDMVVGVAEAVGPAMAQVAIRPADPAAHRLDRRHAPEQRRLAGGTIADMGDTRRLRGSQLQRMELVIVPAAQIDAVALTPALREAKHIDEEGEARLRLVGQELDMAKMGDVEARFGSHRSGPTAAGCRRGGSPPPSGRYPAGA